MLVSPGVLSWPLGGSRPLTDVLDQVCPFQWATTVRPEAQMLSGDSALPSSSPWPDWGCAQRWPLKCQAPSPNTQASRRLSASTSLRACGNLPVTAQLRPVRRKARACGRPDLFTTAQTSPGEVEAAEMTCSPGVPGNEARVQREP